MKFLKTKNNSKKNGISNNKPNVAYHHTLISSTTLLQENKISPSYEMLLNTDLFQ